MAEIASTKCTWWDVGKWCKCSVIRCQKDATQLRLTGLTAQPMSCMIYWLIKRLLPAEVESRTQGSRPRTQKKSEAKDSLSEDRHSRGQGQECSRPRPRTKDTSASALRKKKKRSSQKFFMRSPQKNVFQKIFQPLHKILTIQKIVLSSSRGQANFRGLEASKPRPRT